MVYVSETHATKGTLIQFTTRRISRNTTSCIFFLNELIPHFHQFLQFMEVIFYAAGWEVGSRRVTLRYVTLRFTPYPPTVSGVLAARKLVSGSGPKKYCIGMLETLLVLPKAILFAQSGLCFVVLMREVIFPSGAEIDVPAPETARD